MQPSSFQRFSQLGARYATTFSYPFAAFLIFFAHAHCARLIGAALSTADLLTASAAVMCAISGAGAAEAPVDGRDAVDGDGSGSVALSSSAETVRHAPRLLPGPRRATDPLLTSLPRLDL